MSAEWLIGAIEAVSRWFVEEALPEEYRTASVMALVSLAAWALTIVLPLILLLRQLTLVLIGTTVLLLINPSIPLELAGVIATLFVAAVNSFGLGGGKDFLQ